jgi:hypothetical protein
MLWGVESHVLERFGAAGIDPKQTSFHRDTYTFHFTGTPQKLVEDFRTYYGPTMNAFEAAEKNGKALDLQLELEDLFKSQNTSKVENQTIIPATFLRVTVQVPDKSRSVLM